MRDFSAESREYLYSVYEHATRSTSVGSLLGACAQDA